MRNTRIAKGVGMFLLGGFGVLLFSGVLLVAIIAQLKVGAHWLVPPHVPLTFGVMIYLSWALVKKGIMYMREFRETKAAQWIRDDWEKAGKPL